MYKPAFVVACLVAFSIFSSSVALSIGDNIQDRVESSSNKSSAEERWSKMSRIEKIESMYAWEGFVYSIEVFYSFR